MAKKEFLSFEGLQRLVDNINEKFNAKADKKETDALGKRINNLILSSGTESSAEVVDARTGYDGTAHDTLGTAIRNQVSELKGDLAKLENNIFVPISDVLNIAFENGGINGGSGNNIDNPYRIRSTEWHTLSNEINAEEFNIYVLTGQLICIYCKQNGEDTHSTGWIFDDSTISVPIVKDYRYRFMYQLDGTSTSNVDWTKYFRFSYDGKRYPNTEMPLVSSKVDDVYDFVGSVIINPNFEQGGLNGATGDKVVSDTRIRFAEPISFPYGGKIVIDCGYQFALFRYKLKAGVYEYDNFGSGWVGGNTDKVTYEIEASGTHFFNLMIQSDFATDIALKRGIKVYRYDKLNTKNVISEIQTFDEYAEKPTKNMKVVTMGDSMFLYGNGNLETSWQKVMQKYFGFNEVISVGIGGSGFRWSGSEIRHYDIPSGHSIGDNLPQTSGVSTSATHESAFCSWYRISNTIPSDTDIVIIGTGTNDVGYETFPDDESDMTFVTGSNTDTEWYNSSHYSEFNGDYDLSKLRGAMLSTIMKVQAQAPNALVVFMNFPNSRGIQSQNRTSTVSTELQKPILDAMKYIHELWGIPLIDVCGNSGINPLNRKKYIADAIHPNGYGYATKVANAVISGLKPLLNNGI